MPVSEERAIELEKDWEEAQPYLPHVRGAAKKEGLEPSLLMGVISRETDWGRSRWLDKAGPGGKGDNGHGHGFMQIDDRWHEDFIQSGKWSNPRENIFYGTRHLNDQIKRAGKEGAPDPVRAGVAAYNAGFGRVRRALNEGKDVDAYTTGGDYSKDVLERADWFDTKLKEREKRQQEQKRQQESLMKPDSSEEPGEEEQDEKPDEETQEESRGSSIWNRNPMMDDEGTRFTSLAYVTSIAPDVCKTPPYMTPVPYSIIGWFNTLMRQRMTVRFTGMETFNTLSRITTVRGDEPGSGGGVKSQRNVGFCRSKTQSTTVRVEGNWVVRNNDLMEMNMNGPDGIGNTIGRVIYVEPVQVCYIDENHNIVGDTDPPVEPETEEEKNWFENVWDSAKEKARDAWGATTKVVADYNLIERGIGVLTLAGGIGEMVVGAAGVVIPEPVTTVAGGVAFVHGADSAWAGVRQIISGKFEKTYTEQLAAGTAGLLGADEETAGLIGTVTDVGVGILSPVTAVRGMLRRGAKEGLEQAAKQTTKKVAKTATKDGTRVVRKKAVDKAKILRQNKIRGVQREAEVAKELVDEGHEILGSQVSVKTSRSRRVIDHLIRDGKTDKIRAIEVKSGNAVRSTSQLLKDEAMYEEGGKIIGKNAPLSLKGQRLKIETEVVP